MRQPIDGLQHLVDDDVFEETVFRIGLVEPIEHGEQLDISHIVLMTRAVCLVVIGDENVAQQVPNPEVDTSGTDRP